MAQPSAVRIASICSMFSCGLLNPAKASGPVAPASKRDFDRWRRASPVRKQCSVAMTRGCRSPSPTLTQQTTRGRVPAAAAIISCSTAVATGAFVSGTTALTASSSDRHDRTSKGVSITRSQHSGRLLHSVTLRYLVGGFVTYLAPLSERSAAQPPSHSATAGPTRCPRRPTAASLYATVPQRHR